MRTYCGCLLLLIAIARSGAMAGETAPVQVPSRTAQEPFVAAGSNIADQRGRKFDFGVAEPLMAELVRCAPPSKRGDAVIALVRFSPIWQNGTLLVSEVQKRVERAKQLEPQDVARWARFTKRDGLESALLLSSDTRFFSGNRLNREELERVLKANP